MGEEITRFSDEEIKCWLFKAIYTASLHTEADLAKKIDEFGFFKESKTIVQLSNHNYTIVHGIFKTLFEEFLLKRFIKRVPGGKRLIFKIFDDHNEYALTDKGIAYLVKHSDYQSS